MIIAIDGYSSCGKSTLAKQVAEALEIRFIDTGAMYRAITHYFIQHNIDLDNQDQIKSALTQIDITFDRIDGQNTTFLNGENIEKSIRSSAVSEMVSPVATIPAVRDFLVEQQRAMGQESLVMDGRDIGTVVFPDADHKFFITASVDERVNRRILDLKNRGLSSTYDAVKNNLLTRDKIDSTRAHSPLRQAEDAVLIDNTHLTKEEQLLLVLHHIRVSRK